MAKSEMSGTGRPADVYFPGAGMIILQALRVCTILTLALAGTACWAIIVHTTMNHNFAFFDVTSLAFTSGIALFLMLSEFDCFRLLAEYYRENWPKLSKDSGLTWLGLAMVIIGCNILGKLNLPANSMDKIGPHWWRVVLAGGILSITIGFFNCICSFVWRNGKENVNARHIRSKGKLAECQTQLSLDKTFYSTKTASPSLRNEKTKSKFMSYFWKKDAEADTEKGGSGIRGKLNISAPIQQHDGHPYATSNRNVENGHTDGADTYPHVNTSPIVPGVQRPDSAMHPLRREPSVSGSSFYSTTHYSRMPV